MGAKQLLLSCAVVCLAIAFATVPALASSPFGNGFASGNPADYLDGQFPVDRIRIARSDGVDTLFVTGTRVRFKTVSVTPNTRYTLGFTAAFTGDVEAIEENPRFAVFAMPGQTSPVLPSREIQFLDAAGTPIQGTLKFGMPFRNGHAYADVFHTPPQAAAVRLTISSGDGVTIALQDLAFEEAGKEDPLNVNPAFRLGPFNYSGWQRISAGGKLIERGGKTVFDTKYGSRGSQFPLPGPGTYALSANATGNGYNSCVKVDIFDARGKKLMTAVLRRYDQVQTFVASPEAAFASFLVYSCLLEEVRLVRVGDEKAIEAHAGDR